MDGNTTPEAEFREALARIVPENIKAGYGVTALVHHLRAEFDRLFPPPREGLTAWVNGQRYALDRPGEIRAAQAALAAAGWAAAPVYRGTGLDPDAHNGDSIIGGTLYAGDRT